MNVVYTPEKVCPKQIEFDLIDKKVYNIKFYGGCPGNTKIVSKLLDGWEAEKIVETCKGNLCGIRGTSCVDQLAIAIEKELERQKITN